ncbi:MAG: hypothetical protein SAK29_10805 [Scytonema sp. PMC 1069.18]|nr:hypothetical protein [Scytonema sp. PMC 1069.18]MEC4881936.1 hypothetical protein [Scytonema sp. PMC 1070.18]
MLQILYYIFHTIQPLLVPMCFLCAWTLVIMVAWSMWIAARDSVSTAKQMHQIPCAGCQYFTNDYRLKCTVHPSIANTEDAVNCMDYQPQTNPLLY